MIINVTRTLHLKKHLSASNSDPSKFDSHVWFKMIHEKYPEIILESFNFKLVSDNDVRKEIENLNIKKSSIYGPIPASVLKQYVDAYLPKPTILINYSFPHNSFPQKLKLFEVIPLCKKLDPLQKENYRPVSLLLHTSKVFERIIHKQITSYMRDKLNKSITGFRKSHGSSIP